MSIKLATDNIGTFSTENDDVQMAIDENSEKNITFAENEQYITVAPYFRNKLTSENKEQLAKETEVVKDRAQKLATLMGLQIDEKETVYGVYLGSPEITYQYRINSSDSELVDLFAALMGDLSYEYQDAVIAANYVKQGKENAYEVILNKPNAKIENIEADLKKKGIGGTTYHFNDGKLTFFVDLFKYTDNGLPILKTQEELETEINNIKSLNEYGYKYESKQEQNSRYLDNESRQKLYRNYLELGKSKETGSRIARGLPTREQERELNNVCQKALAICEAAAIFPDKKDEQKRIEAAQKAERDWEPQAPNDISGIASEKLKDAINTGKWSKEALSELENIINRIKKWRS